MTVFFVAAWCEYSFYCLFYIKRMLIEENLLRVYMWGFYLCCQLVGMQGNFVGQGEMTLAGPVIKEQ